MLEPARLVEGAGKLLEEELDQEVREEEGRA